MNTPFRREAQEPVNDVSNSTTNLAKPTARQPLTHTDLDRLSSQRVPDSPPADGRRRVLSEVDYQGHLLSGRAMLLLLAFATARTAAFFCASRWGFNADGVTDQLDQ